MMHINISVTLIASVSYRAKTDGKTSVSEKDGSFYVTGKVSIHGIAKRLSEG